MSSIITRIFRAQVEEFLARGISKGTLILTRDDESPRIFGENPSIAEAANRPIATIHLVNPPSFYTRITTQADIGFSEAYMAGDFIVSNTDHLVTVFRVLILNRDEKSLSTPAFLLSRIGANFNAVLHALNRNTLSGSKKNIEAHYDLSNALFGTFLGETWVYSCALFRRTKTITTTEKEKKLDDDDDDEEYDEDNHNNNNNNIGLDEAQRMKIDTVLKKACIQPGDEILDIGCGWGELAIRAVQQYDCKVTGITLSKEQLTLAKERVKQANIPYDRIEFELIDYRDLAKREGKKFDRIISIEMIEAVGHEFLPTYFKSIDDMLKPYGVAVIQVITTPDQRYDTYRNGTDFIQKHIFPGGLCPSLNAMSSAMTNHTTLGIEHLENISTHYATTLKEWRRRFLQAVKTELVAKAGADFDNDIFIRKWIYYLCYCESGFATRTLGLLQLVLSRPNNVLSFGEPPKCAQI